MATLTPVATTATKKSSWKAAVDSPVMITRRQCERASLMQGWRRPVTSDATTRAVTAAIARKAPIVNGESPDPSWTS